MSPAGLGEGPHIVESYSFKRGLYYRHGDKGVSDCGPRRYPLALGTPLTMTLNILFYPPANKILRGPVLGSCPCPCSQEVGVGHKQHLAYVRPGNN